MSFLKNKILKNIFATRPKEKTAALILAAGQSTRMGGEVSKQFLPICGIPVLAHTLLAYQASETISEIIVAARKEDFDRIAEIRKEYGITKLHTVVSGGNNRLGSAQRAFSKIPPDTHYVAVADGARCLITPDIIDEVCRVAYRTHAASAAQRITGTVKRATAKGAIRETVDRTGLWEAQTPQVFHVAVYGTALNSAIAQGIDVTDDNSMVERIGHRIQLVECSKENMKITTPEDLQIASAIIAVRYALEE